MAKSTSTALARSHSHPSSSSSILAFLHIQVDMSARLLVITACVVLAHGKLFAVGIAKADSSRLLRV